MSTTNKYTKEARQTLVFAKEEALRLRHRAISPEHLLLGLLRVNDILIENIFESLHLNTTRVTQAIEFVIGRGNKVHLSDPALNAAARYVIANAEVEAARAASDLIGIEHLLLGILGEENGAAAGVLASFNMSLEAVREYLAQLASAPNELAQQPSFSKEYQARYDATPTLNEVSRDLTAAALIDALDPMIGREEELERTMQILSRRSKNNPVLLGTAGVGKTAIAEGLAQRIIEGKVPENLLNRRVVSLDVAMLTVGTKFRGDYEERLKKIMQEILDDKGIIMVIDELHTLMSSGVADGSVDAANLFKPMLARGEFQCIGATTYDEYRKTIESDQALERRFQPVQVRETNERETLAILHGLRFRYEAYHHVTLSNEALKAAVRMSSRYIQGRFQPDKSIDLIDEAASSLRVQQTVVPEAIRQLRDRIVIVQRDKDHEVRQHNFALASLQRAQELRLRQELQKLEYEWRMQQIEQTPTITEQHIAEIVAKWTGIPVAQIALEEAQHLLVLEEELHKRVIGQHEAVQAVARAVRRSRTNLRDSRRPIGSFLFVGPTGVGKTELASALAGTLFGDEGAMLKLDMSEFMEQHSVSRLIGSPPGYVGYDSAGQLTEAVRRRPYSVVLFDEIEKAHPKIFDLLLQILDDGCLTDTHGQTVDFRNTIVIMTSNVGTARLKANPIAFTSRHQNEQEELDAAYEQLRSTVTPALKEMFKPELLNRIDEIVLFHALEQTHLHEIVNIMIEQTQKRLAAQAITMEVSAKARHLLVKHGYDPIYGARPLRRTVQSMLEDMLAEAILQGECVANDTIVVDATNDRLHINHHVPALVERITAYEAA
jgi:ATP-dependent Clp protease ATP-binding subunit ClpC